MKKDSVSNQGGESIPKPSVGVLGLGRFGGALARGLREAGYTVHGRDRNSTPDEASWVRLCDVLCLAVRDDQIPGVTARLLLRDIAGKTVLIHAGTTPLAVLEPLMEKGAVPGKFHPLQTFNQPHDPAIPPGTPFAVEGRVTEIVAPWVHAWSGNLYQLSSEQWTPYHLAAVVAANFLPLLIRSGAEILGEIAPNRGEALTWLRPLIEGSVAAALDPTNPSPFSGPAIRGDLDTLARHERYLDRHWPELLSLYQAASELILKKTSREKP